MITVQRIMGSETEFGIVAVGNRPQAPMRDSARVVDAYAGPRGLKSAQSFWDFGSETPLADARGFLMNLADAHESQLTHLPQAQPEAQYLANVVLENGARLYVDHAHPEYSSPEVTNPRDIVTWDRAGDRVAEEAVKQLLTTGQPVDLYKNNTDSKGASYGTHENYLVDRNTGFEKIVEGLLPFFATRQIFCGAGKVGIGREGEEPGFQISQRADFFEECVGLETTLRRPIVNTRDEPHADPVKYRRLHVIIGDATLAEVATFVRFGSTSLVLSLIEQGLAPVIELADPVTALQTVSHDLSLSAPLELADGSTMTALEIQRAFYTAAAEAADPSDEQTAQVLAEWDRLLTGLATDPMSLADSIDWVGKLALMNSYRQREGLDWNSPKLALIDVQYTDVRQEKGLFYRLERAGRFRRLTTDEEVERAMTTPPEDTRAYLRGTVVDRLREDLVAASWESIVMRRGDSAVRIPMSEPLKGTRELLEERLNRAVDTDSLLAALGVTTIDNNSTDDYGM